MSNKDIPPWVFYREIDLKHALINLEFQTANFKHFIETYAIKEILNDKQLEEEYKLISTCLIQSQKELKELKEKFKKDIC